ncbi:Hsp70 protein-domain-containing protein [Globomyces pollinis-pini]|nr:Hsp70 protein-domain-containing protein [Globomyces pollinis-pini]
MVKTSRGTTAFKHSDNQVYELEELVAYLLAHAKKQAENYAEVNVSGAVITVPPSFTQFERQAILDAAEIANLKVFALISDETAVAINFAMGKKFPKKEYHIFYDMGAGTTIASLVSFHSGTDTKSSIKNLVDLEIKAHITDGQLGGNHIDMRLQDYLAKQFMTINKGKLKGNVFDNSRAMARLLKEANRCKHILSANHDVFASVENLMEDLDFKVQVSRETLEGLIEDLVAKVTGPLKAVLVASNVSLDEVKSLVLVGGGVRVPAVQKLLGEYMGESKIARNVDGDEAAVFGAVLHAAAVSSQFKLGFKARIKDVIATPINVAYDNETAGGRRLATLLFPKKSVLGAKKLMTFKRVTDFDFDIDYLVDTQKTPIMRVKVSGLTDLVESYKDKALSAPKVKVLISVTESGLLSIKDATASFEVEAKPESLKDTVMNFFGNKKADDKDQKVPEGTEEVGGEDDEKKAETKPVAKKVLVETKPLKLEFEYFTVVPLSEEAKQTMAKRLQSMDSEDKSRFLREESINKLETYIYKCKELSWDDDFEEIATGEEQETIKSHASEASEWLEDNLETGTLEDFVNQRKALIDIAKPVFSRRREAEKRPQVIEKLRKDIEMAQSMLDMINAKIDDLDVKAEDLNAFHDLLTIEKEWIDGQETLQNAVPKNQDPILTVKILQDRISTFGKSLLKFDMGKMFKPKKKPMPEPPVKDETVKSNNTESSTDSESKDKDGDVPPTEDVKETDDAPQKESDEL